MGRAHIESIGSDGFAVKLDVGSELAAFELRLRDFKRPVSPVLRKRALEIATGIIARAPATERTDVNARLRTILRRHGMYSNDLRSR